MDRWNQYGTWSEFPLGRHRLHRRYRCSRNETSSVIEVLPRDGFV